MLYKNINIITGIPADVEACKKLIDHLQVNDYRAYEVIGTMSAHLQHPYYSTCLHEDANQWIIHYNGLKCLTTEQAERVIEETKKINADVAIFIKPC